MATCVCHSKGRNYDIILFLITGQQKIELKYTYKLKIHIYPFHPRGGVEWVYGFFLKKQFFWFEVEVTFST